MSNLLTDEILVTNARDSWKFNEPILAIGVENGIVWAVRRGPFAGIDGCVMIPPDSHPWCAGFPDDFRGRFKVHGNISWDAFPWLGFDTAHAFDKWDLEFDPRGYQALLDTEMPSTLFQEKRWTLGLVIQEAKSLARQLAVIAE